MCNTPTDKQIEFANRIAEMLNIDFPTGSPDFNRQTYWKFINDNIDKYLDMRMGDPTYDDDELTWYDPFAERGY